MTDRTLAEAMGMTDDETAELRERVEGRPCDAHGCTRQAVVALRFHDQPGHVHDCAPCAHDLREFCDVVESHPLPCPWAHNGTTWTDQPRELR